MELIYKVMINKILFIQSVIVSIFCLSHTAYSQQWVDEKYKYDSIINVNYGTALSFSGTMDNLALDLYIPQCDDSAHISKRPLMIWIHGGAMISGDKNDMSDLCRSFAKAGYVTASVNYRLGIICDSAAWSCNFPNYSCLFASDTAEWYRAAYRAMQDVKGAIRYLVNRSDIFRIDKHNIFVSGESAGAITALCVGLMDNETEKWPQTLALNSVPKPNSNTLACVHNLFRSFSNDLIQRPDLGNIEGNIEISNNDYTIKGIGNIFGGIFTNLLRIQNTNKPKPAIFSFHQPCDLLVSIDSKKIFWGLTWCFTNGYNCSGLINTPIMHGSRAINNWNVSNNYGYVINNQFTETDFPFNYILGKANCIEQMLGGSCHSYDNRAQRIKQLAQFFAPIVSTSPICDTVKITNNPNGINDAFQDNTIIVYPNPSNDKIFFIENINSSLQDWKVKNILGETVCVGKDNRVDLTKNSQGVYILNIKSDKGSVTRMLLIQQ